MAAINSSAGEPTAVRWGDVPDPRDPRAPAGARTAVVLEYHVWQHILGKHVLPGREPWSAVFSDEVLERLIQVDGGRTLGEPVVTEALERLGGQIRAALERPLALLYEVRPLGWARKYPLRQWILVLPSGATAYVHERKGRNRLATCYFPAYALVVKNEAFRWRRVAARFVRVYGVFDTQRNALTLPEPGTVKFVPQQGPVRELRSAIRFVTPTSWGFCPELEGAPWRGRLGEWPAAEPAGPRRRHRLKPRRRRSSGEEDASV